MYCHINIPDAAGAKSNDVQLDHAFQHVAMSADWIVAISRKVWLQ